MVFILTDLNRGSTGCHNHCLYSITMATVTMAIGTIVAMTTVTGAIVTVKLSLVPLLPCHYSMDIETN